MLHTRAAGLALLIDTLFEHGAACSHAATLPFASPENAQHLSGVFRGVLASRPHILDVVGNSARRHTLNPAPLPAASF